MMMMTPSFTISSLAVPYNTKTGIRAESGAYYLECVERSAVSNSINDGHEVLFLMNHDDSLLQGSTRSNLRLFDKEDGLYFEVDIDDTTQIGGRALFEVQSGISAKCSIRFRSAIKEWGYNVLGPMIVPVCEISKFDLVEISLVGPPAYKETYARVGGLNLGPPYAGGRESNSFKRIRSR